MTPDLVNLALADEALGHAHTELDTGRRAAAEARADLDSMASELLEGQQLMLIAPEPTAPKFTERQQAVLDALTHAGQDGLDTDQAGAIAHALKEGRWAHSPADRCQFCARDGKSILQRLEQLGLARYRRANRARSIPGAWLSATAQAAEPEIASGMLRDDEPIPF